jgi:hypothetical protein
VWSTAPDIYAIDFPTKNLNRFMYNHHLSQIIAKLYHSEKDVESILSRFPPSQLHLSTPAYAVWSGEGNSILEISTRKLATFDHIIFART